MPIISIKTTVRRPLAEVKSKFNRALFLALSPPFPKALVEKFDGCSPGDKVQLTLNFILFKQQWHGVITEESSTDVEWYFIDEGEILPFPLKSWKHKHALRVDASSGKTLIHDYISFSTGSWLLDRLSYPLFFMMFYYRKPIYRKYFA
jgi:ligand-binding SRPBCC domain-containing protein